MRLYFFGFCSAICFLVLVLKIYPNLINFVYDVFPLRESSTPSVSLEKSSWSKITLNENISAKDFLLTLSSSCNILLQKKSGIIAIDSKYWIPICDRANKSKNFNEIEAIQIIHQYLIPISIKINGSDEGLATGYFEIELSGRDSYFPGYVPIYMKPSNIIDVDLSEFDKELVNRTISGQIVGKRLRPLPARKEINEGIYEGKNLEIAWIKDEIEVFFLHIQGSGRLKFPDGTIVRIAYSGSNGHKYKSIGREMVSLGLIDKKDLSMQSIKRWLKENPDAVKDILEKNPRYIFFKKIDIQIGPIGAASVALKADNSVAVDTKYYPMGLPFFVKTHSGNSYLLVAQDVGSAIRGPLRLDIFMGSGEIAGLKAGKMAENIKIWALIPHEALKSLKLSQNSL